MRCAELSGHPQLVRAPVVVRLPDGRALRFSGAFFMGREQGCEVHIDDAGVSRRHAEVTRLRGAWIIQDLQSSNGLFVDGARVESARIGDGVTVTLGPDGPVLEIAPEEEADAAPAERAEPATEDSAVLDAYARRYFGDDSGENVGGRTLMIRRAFQMVREQQRRRDRWTSSWWHSRRSA